MGASVSPRDRVPRREGGALVGSDDGDVPHVWVEVFEQADGPPATADDDEALLVLAGRVDHACVEVVDHGLCDLEILLPPADRVQRERVERDAVGVRVVVGGRVVGPQAGEGEAERADDDKGGREEDGPVGVGAVERPLLVGWWWDGSTGGRGGSRACCGAEREATRRRGCERAAQRCARAQHGVAGEHGESLGAQWLTRGTAVETGETRRGGGAREEQTAVTLTRLDGVRIAEIHTHPWTALSAHSLDKHGPLTEDPHRPLGRRRLCHRRSALPPSLSLFSAEVGDTMALAHSCTTDPQHLPAIAHNQDTLQLVALYSRSLKSATSLLDAARRLPSLASSADSISLYSDDHPDPQSHSLDALLDRTDIDAVALCLPIPAQPAIIRRCLSANKHVLSEKPLAPSLAEARALVQEYERDHAPRGVHWLVAEQFPYAPAWEKARDLVRQGKLGTLVGFDARVFIQPTLKAGATNWRRVPDYQGGCVLPSLPRCDLASFPFSFPSLTHRAIPQLPPRRRRPLLCRPAPRPLGLGLALDVLPDRVDGPQRARDPAGPRPPAGRHAALPRLDVGPSPVRDPHALVRDPAALERQGVHLHRDRWCPLRRPRRGPTHRPPDARLARARGRAQRGAAPAPEGRDRAPRADGRRARVCRVRGRDPRGRARLGGRGGVGGEGAERAEGGHEGLGGGRGGAEEWREGRRQGRAEGVGRRRVVGGQVGRRGVSSAASVVTRKGKKARMRARE